MRNTKVLGVRLPIKQFDKFVAKARDNNTSHIRAIKDFIDSYIGEK